MKHYQVVAAVIEHEGQILCMQRGKTRFAYTSYKFEFPGGKIEPNETAQEALKRELMEEMNYPIEVKQSILVVYHAYPDFEITMQAFLCGVENRHFHLNEHIAYRWLEKEKLKSLDWADADVPVVEAVANMKSKSVDKERNEK